MEKQRNGRIGGCKARQGKTRRGEARQGEARQGETRQGKARQGEARQGEALLPQQFPTNTLFLWRLNSLLQLRLDCDVSLLQVRVNGPKIQQTNIFFPPFSLFPSRRKTLFDSSKQICTSFCLLFLLFFQLFFSCSKLGKQEILAQ